VADLQCKHKQDSRGYVFHSANKEHRCWVDWVLVVQRLPTAFIDAQKRIGFELVNVE